MPSMYDPLLYTSLPLCSQTLHHKLACGESRQSKVQGTRGQGYSKGCLPPVLQCP